MSWGEIIVLSIICGLVAGCISHLILKCKRILKSLRGGHKQMPAEITIADVIKSLECCVNYPNSCGECCLNDSDSEYCSNLLNKYALDVISVQKLEIELLKEDVNHYLEQYLDLLSDEML